MKKIGVTILIAVLLLGLLSSCRGTPSNGGKEVKTLSEKIIGDWSGNLEVPGMKLPLVFHLFLDDDGDLVATMDSPNQGAFGIAATKVLLKEYEVVIKFASVAGSYEGSFDENSKTISGTWKQSGGSYPLNLTPGAAAAESPRPQTPKPPFPYRTEEVTIEHDGIQLAGTLTIPEGDGPFPGVVLITGSGPQNRDEEIFGHKPFLVLADYLTKHNIAVLRYDDRGIGSSTGNFAAATSEDFAVDAKAVLRFLAERPEIDDERTGLIGHSEGGIISTMLGAVEQDVDFIVLLAGPACPGDEIIYQQSAAILRVQGVDEEIIQKLNEQRALLFNILKREGDITGARQELDKILIEMGIQQENIRKQEIRKIESPWFRSFLRYDPCPDLERIEVPVLALIGSRDLQVLAEVNIPALKEHLGKSGNPDVTVLEIEGLNHLFQPAETGLIAEYNLIETTIAPSVLELIAGWILDRF